jgi:DNA-binding NarL/FixJ family response regulator
MYLSREKRSLGSAHPPGLWSYDLKSPPSKIRLLIVEDNRLLREGIATLIREYSDITIVAALGTGDNIPQRYFGRDPLVVLLDLGLRSQNSLALVTSLKARAPSTRIIMMDLIPTESDILEYVRAGVSGFILKDATMEDFIRTIRSVSQGAKVLPTLLTGSLFTQIVDHAIHRGTVSPAALSESVRMTRRERQVIALISDGMTNKEIAQKLHLSTYTIKSHVHNILEKLTLHTRVQIARYAHTTDGFQTVADTVSLIDDSAHPGE